MFAFRLARELGKTVGELFATMDVEEFAYWLAFQQIEPLDFDAQDIRAGMLLSTYINAHRDPAKGGQPVAPFDLLPWRRKSADSAAKPLYQLSDDEQLAHWRALIAAQNSR